MKLAIAMPTMRYMDSKTAICLAGLCATAAQDPAVDDLIVKNLSIGYIDLSRTMLAVEVLNMGADAILWFDHDMIFPADTFSILNTREVAVVGALYRTRTPPKFDRLDPPPDATRAPHKFSAALSAREWLPNGVMLVRKEVYAAMFKAGQQFYRAGWGLDPEQPHAHIGEDIDFSRRARALGFALWADMQLTQEVQHIAEVPLHWNTFGMEQGARPQGVVGAKA